MTTTPHGQVPETLTYERDRAIMEGERNASLDAYSRVVLLTSAESRLYEAAFTNGWDRCVAHVQKPTEIEHVADDVSKNWAEVNMSTQPGAVYAELPGFDRGYESIWNLIFKWEAATPGEDAYKKAAAVERAIINALYDFADRTHALRMEQATKETSGGFHVWRDISTAPKDGSRFVATGHNYGLYSEGRHACVAQWFRGCWIEASDWNETSELIYLTHWMPLPSPPDDVAAPAEQQASATEGYVQPVPDKCDRITWRGRYYHLPLIEQTAPKAAPGEPTCKQSLQVQVWVLPNGGGGGQFSWEPQDERFWTKLVPQQEPVAWESTTPGYIKYITRGRYEKFSPNVQRWYKPYKCSSCSAPQPAPAPLSRDQIREVFMAHGFTIKEGQTDLKQYVYDAAYALLGTKPAPLSDDDAKDAARYRWLRATTNFATNSQGERIDVRNQPDKWDAAIDAARKQGDTP